MRAGTFNEAYSRRTAVRRMMNNDDIKGAIIELIIGPVGGLATAHAPGPVRPLVAAQVT